MAIEKIIWAISCFGKQTQKGYVELRLEDKVVQISPKEAQEFAYSILAAAEAAETDEFLMHWLKKIAPGQIDNHARLLQEFRQFRDSKRREVRG